jgi:hypothetical protein
MFDKIINFLTEHWFICGVLIGTILYYAMDFIPGVGKKVIQYD